MHKYLQITLGFKLLYSKITAVIVKLKTTDFRDSHGNFSYKLIYNWLKI